MPKLQKPLTPGHQFVEALRRLHSIDESHLPREWSKERRARFCDDPVAFVMRADDPTVDLIWTWIKSREGAANDA